MSRNASTSNSNETYFKLARNPDQPDTKDGRLYPNVERMNTNRKSEHIFGANMPNYERSYNTSINQRNLATCRNGGFNTNSPHRIRHENEKFTKTNSNCSDNSDNHSTPMTKGWNGSANKNWGGGFDKKNANWNSRNEFVQFDNMAEKKDESLEDEDAKDGRHYPNAERMNTNRKSEHIFGANMPNYERSYNTPINRRNLATCRNGGFNTNSPHRIRQENEKFTKANSNCYDNSDNHSTPMTKGWNGSANKNWGGGFDKKNDNWNSRNEFVQFDNMAEKIDESLEDEAIKTPQYVPNEKSIEQIYKEDQYNWGELESPDNDLDLIINGLPFNKPSIKIDNWETAGIDLRLLRNIKRSRYVTPRKIQASAIPIIMDGYDLFAQAETGSGKTAAFLLPIINMIIENGSPPYGVKCSPMALIISPTRELTRQIYEQAKKLGEGTGITVAQAHGQYKYSDFIKKINAGCEILVATMGRLLDIVKKEIVNLSFLTYFVLDEADRLLVGDFSENIKELLKYNFPANSKRQTLLFAATFSDDVLALADELLLKNRIIITNGKSNFANPLIEQEFLQVEEMSKRFRLKEVIENKLEEHGEEFRILVFVATKRKSDAIAIFLCSSEIKAVSINGDRSQEQRDQALQDFRSGQVSVLVATDVCARGIHISRLDYVINYDLPKERSVYVNRIGRTGRMRRGFATSFVTSLDNELAPSLVDILINAHQEVPNFLSKLANLRI